jgi:hypothetical protein
MIRKDQLSTDKIIARYGRIIDYFDENPERIAVKRNSDYLISIVSHLQYLSVIATSEEEKSLATNLCAKVFSAKNLNLADKMKKGYGEQK